MLNVTIIGKEEVILRFDKMPGKIHDAVFRAITSLSLMLENYVKTQKLSGQVLQHRTGRLQSSIHNEVKDNGTVIEGRIFSASPMPYAAIHEFGFNGTEQVREHIRTMVFGKEVPPFTVKSFERHMNMPERSFMRSSLAENADKIPEEISKEVAAAVDS